MTTGLTSLLDAPGHDRLSLEPGEILIREGDDADSVFILVTGSLEVSRSVDDETAVLAIIDQPGAVIGEIVALGGGKRTATVRATTRAQVMEVSPSDFQDALQKNPELAEDLVAMAVRRAEEGELAELLAHHFGIVDEETLTSTCNSVEWRRLKQGEILLREGDESDSVFFVVRGRLVATTIDPLNGERVKIGEAGRGDVVGEMGLLGHTPRTATVTAVRDTVVAGLGEFAFLSLVERQPRMMIELSLRAVARAKDPRWHSAPSTVLAVINGTDSPIDWLLDDMETELGRHGIVRRLSPERVDLALETPGVFDVERGEIGDVRVSRLVHEFELDADHLLVETGEALGPWSRRALGMADQAIVIAEPDLPEDRAALIRELLGGCPTGVARTLVLVHPRSDSRPTWSRNLSASLGTDQVINIEAGSASDSARLARVAVGRANTLVLSGGGGRGFAHVGVYRALGELGFPVDLIGGTSMGAIIGAVMADRFEIDEIVAWTERHFPKSMDYTIPVVSLIKGSRIAKSASETFGERDIEDLWLSYFAMSTDLTTSRSHIHDGGSIALAIRATSAIPGVMPPVPYGDALLIDGGVLNNLPLDVARLRAPAGRVIAVDVAPPRGPSAHGDYGLSVSGWDAIRSRFGSDRSPYPSISAVLMRSMITASMRARDDHVLNGLADCYLDLDMRGVSMLEFDHPADVAQRGYETALPLVADWLATQGA
jgi:lysophospholipid hydrolase